MKYQPLRRSINFSSPWLENERGREINCCPIKQVSILYIALLVLSYTYLLPNDAKAIRKYSFTSSGWLIIRTVELLTGKYKTTKIKLIHSTRYVRYLPTFTVVDMGNLQTATKYLILAFPHSFYHTTLAPIHVNSGIECLEIFRILRKAISIRFIVNKNYHVGVVYLYS